MGPFLAKVHLEPSSFSRHEGPLCPTRTYKISGLLDLFLFFSDAGSSSESAVSSLSINTWHVVAKSLTSQATMASTLQESQIPNLPGSSQLSQSNLGLLKRRIAELEEEVVALKGTPQVKHQ